MGLRVRGSGYQPGEEDPEYAPVGEHADDRRSGSVKGSEWACSCGPPTSAPSSLDVRRGDAPVDLGKALRQLGDLPEDGIAVRAEHLRQVDGPLAVDGETEEGDALQTSFRDGLPRVFDAVGTFIFILVVGLAI